jgi:hypothetical protein
MEPKVNPQESSTRLRKALFIYLATALLVLMIFVSLTIFFTLFDHLKKAEDQGMIHAAKTRAMTLAEWYRRGKDLAWQITSRSRIRQELEKYNQGEIPLAEVTSFTEPKLQDAMDLSKDIIGILILDANHRTIAACGYGTDMQMTDKPLDKFIFNDIALLDPLRINGRLSIVASAPIRNRNGERQGTDLVILDTNRLHAIVSDAKLIGRKSRIIIGYPSNGDTAILFPTKREPGEELTRLDLSNAIKAIISEAIAGKRTVPGFGIRFHSRRHQHAHV